MSSDHFLTRWSRRKQQVREAEEPAREAPPAEAGTAPPEEPSPSVQSQLEGMPAPLSEPEMSAEEIARLPSLEELTADMDVTMFLRKGVPEPLRNAALRRMWSLDPKIRDFVCEAREYAYDWNTPGGVPGFGPLQATAEEVARMAARIVGGETVDPPRADGEINSDTAARSLRDQEESSSPRDEAKDIVATRDEKPAVDQELSGRTIPPAAPTTLAPTDENMKPGAAQPGRFDDAVLPAQRRHGGALPV